MRTHVYECTACGRVITNILRWVTDDGQAYHDKGFDDIRQRDMLPGFGVMIPACGPLRHVTTAGFNNEPSHNPLEGASDD